MPYLLVRHKIADFETWKDVFDSHAEAHKKSGLKIKHILRNYEEPSEIILFFEAEDIERAKAFVFSPDVPGSQQESGVLDQPDIYFLDDA